MGEFVIVMRVLQRVLSAPPAKALRRLLTTTTSAPSSSYQSIGSFHSENLGDLIARSEIEYRPPLLPFGESVTPSDDSDFLLDLDQWTFLNHGAFGAALTVGFDRAAQWRRYLEAQPLRYHDRDLLPHLAYSCRRLASFVNADPRNLALLPNVTSGFNSLLAGYVREVKDAAHIIVWDTSYGSVKKMAKLYGGNRVTEIPFQSRYLTQLADPLENPSVVFQTALDDHLLLNSKKWEGKQPLLVLDHTTSNTALTFPIEALAAHAKSIVPNLLVAVDGAHGLLAQNLDIAQIPSVDFYLSNGHKWLSAPRGVAFLHATGAFHDTILRQPAIVSHGIDEPDLLSRYVWDGCRDYAAALSLPSILEFWEEREPWMVRKNLKIQLRQGIKILATEWYGSDFGGEESWPGRVTLAEFDSPVLSPMALVQLPVPGKTSGDAKAVQDYLYKQHIEAPIKCVNERLYVRISCQMYNTSKDFHALAASIQTLSKLTVNAGYL